MTMDDLSKEDKKKLQKWVLAVNGFPKAIILLTKSHDLAFSRAEWDRVDKIAKSIDYVKYLSKFGLKNLVAMVN